MKSLILCLGSMYPLSLLSEWPLLLVAFVMKMVRNELGQYLLTMECIRCNLLMVIRFPKGSIPRFLKVCPAKTNGGQKEVSIER